MKKIAFVIPSLEGGGAERVTINIINNLDPNKFEVILVVGKNEGKLKETLSAKVRVYDLQVERMSRSFKGILKVLEREKPDILFSVMGYVNLICMLLNLLLGNKYSVVLTEHATVSMEYKQNPTLMMKLQRKLKKILYPKASRIICVSQGVKRDLENFLNVRLKNATVIYNPVLSEDFYKNIEEAEHEWFNKDNFVLITAGRLVPEKGHTHLIEAMNELVNIRKEDKVKLLVLGEGPERESLERLVEQKNLKNNIELLGFQQNVKGYFLKSQAFALSSIYEGLPTVLIEAMGLKLPVISTRCPSGPEEILSNKNQGILVPVADPYSLAEAVLQLKKDNNLRIRLGEQGYLRSFDFQTKKIVKEYESLFNEVCRERK